MSETVICYTKRLSRTIHGWQTLLCSLKGQRMHAALMVQLTATRSPTHEHVLKQSKVRQHWNGILDFRADATHTSCCTHAMMDVQKQQTNLMQRSESSCRTLHCSADVRHDMRSCAAKQADSSCAAFGTACG